MNKYIFYLLLTFASSQIAYPQEIKESQISGKVTKITESTIKIGNQTVPIAKDGGFTYINKKEWPVLLSVSYAGMQWTIFMKPGSNIEMLIPEQKVKAIQYKEDLKETNTYLLEIISINQEVNAYFNENWQPIHILNQSEFVAIIDSLKNVYFDHLTSENQRYKALSKEFIELWKAEINFGFNELVLHYPDRHLQYTKNSVELSEQSIAYALTLKIDKPEFLDIPNYKMYAKACIDFESDKLIKKDTSQKHYNIKKIEAAFSAIDKLFSNQSLKDFWFTEYLKKYIDDNGITNSKEQLKQFEAVSKTEVFKIEIEDLTKKINNQRNDHEIYVYKSKNHFALEAHVFRPKEADKSQKRPAIAIFHGGGWVIGKASWAFGRAKHFAEQGMVGVAVQYRLSNFEDITPIEAMEDSRDVMIWLRTHADSLGINSDKIAGEGWSAGGHLITSTAFFPETTSDKEISSAPNALILKSPALEADSWCVQLLGTRDIDPKTISPIDNIKEGMSLPPILILQGRTDNVTPTEKAQLFHDRMKAANLRCELVIYEDCGHLFTPSYLDDTQWPRPDKEISKKANEKADEFLRKLGYIEK